MIKLASSTLMLILSMSATSVFAVQCPAINCDCDSLSDERWVSACKSHETQIKKSCVANSNVPKDYCAVHGPAAKPLPLAIDFSEVKADKKLDVTSAESQVKESLWALKADLQEGIEAYDKKSFQRSVQILQLVDENLDKTFAKQRSISAHYKEAGDAKKLNARWKSYADGSEEFLEKIEAFGDRLAKGIDSAENAKMMKINSVLAQKVLRMTGKTYEQIGYAYGQSDRHRKAAKVWKQGSEVAVRLSEIEKVAGAKSTSIKFTEFMAASRLHRASYHWLLGDDAPSSIGSLKDSQQYVDRAVQKNIEQLVSTPGAEDPTSALTGR